MTDLITCPVCGAENDPTNDHCEECSSPLAGGEAAFLPEGPPAVDGEDEMMFTFDEEYQSPIETAEVPFEPAAFDADAGGDDEDEDSFQEPPFEAADGIEEYSFAEPDQGDAFDPHGSSDPEADFETGFSDELNPYSEPQTGDWPTGDSEPEEEFFSAPEEEEPPSIEAVTGDHPFESVDAVSEAQDESEEFDASPFDAPDVQDPLEEEALQFETPLSDVSDLSEEDPEAPASPAASIEAQRSTEKPSIEVQALPEPGPHPFPASLTLFQSKEALREIDLEEAKTLVGIGSENAPADLDLSDLGIEGLAPRHLAIFRQNKNYTLYVLADAHTQLNDELLRLGERRPLHSGDVITLADDLALRFQIPLA